MRAHERVLSLQTCFLLTNYEIYWEKLIYFPQAHITLKSFPHSIASKRKKSTLVVVSSYELCVVFVFSRLNTLAAGKWLQCVSNLPPAQYLTLSQCYVRINNREEGTHILRVWYEQKIHTRARRVPKLKSKLITWLIMSQICSLCEDEHQLCVGFWSCAECRLSSLAGIRYSSKR